MTDVRIAIIVGSTRPGRQARAVADWVLEQASTRPGARYEIVDLADHPLPHGTATGRHCGPEGSADPPCCRRVWERRLYGSTSCSARQVRLLGGWRH